MLPEHQASEAVLAFVRQALVLQEKGQLNPEAARQINENIARYAAQIRSSASELVVNGLSFEARFAWDEIGIPEDCFQSMTEDQQKMLLVLFRSRSRALPEPEIHREIFPAIPYSQEMFGPVFEAVHEINSSLASDMQPLQIDYQSRPYKGEVVGYYQLVPRTSSQ